MNWRPIETAPRDGTDVVLCEAGQPYAAIGYWRTDRKASGGFWDDGAQTLLVDNPTHWVPISELAIPGVAP